jgi:hypothetical protein
MTTTQHTTRCAMDQNTATPQPGWAALGWITHRQPTAADADGLNEVVVPDAIGATLRKGKHRTCDYRLIVHGQPWWSVYAAKAEPTEPAPTEADCIAALERRLTDLEALFWAHNHRASITRTTPAIPQS